MAVHPGWPAKLTAGAVLLRPPRLRDGRAWSELRLRNERWLEAWEPTSSTPTPVAPLSAATFARMPADTPRSTRSETKPSSQSAPPRAATHRSTTGQGPSREEVRDRVAALVHREG